MSVKVALVSFEYPPDTAYGGIATYTFQAARMLVRRGHHVEVFASSPLRSGTYTENGATVHRVKEIDARRFGEQIGPTIAARHAEVQFDVMEGPEYQADARDALRLVPDIPLVTKLHTPSSLLLRLNFFERSLRKRIWHYASGLLRGTRPAWGYDQRSDGYREYVEEIDRMERRIALEADEIVSPSEALRVKMIREWRLAPDRVVTIPYPFEPPERLLSIPTVTRTRRVSFLGRLETRKGVLAVAAAIPRVLERYPDVRFRFIGSSDSSPDPKVDMRRYLDRELQAFRRRVEFTGGVAYDRIPALLAETDICLFPSLWENFPYACLEAMAGARAIIAGDEGGMAEMLDFGAAGELVPPGSSPAIVEALLKLLGDSQLRLRLGRRARERILTEYSVDRIGVLQEASYRRAIRRRRECGARTHVAPTDSHGVNA